MFVGAIELVLVKSYYILKPIWFLASQKTKSWLLARHVVQAGSYPRTGKRRGLYSGKIVFGLLPKTILR
jgi:hypothetical protein